MKIAQPPDLTAFPHTKSGLTTPFIRKDISLISDRKNGMNLNSEVFNETEGVLYAIADTLETSTFYTD